MIRERWSQVIELFHAALEHPSESRAHFLDTACGDDPELRSAVVTLLESDALAEAEGFLTEPHLGAAADQPARQYPDFGDYRDITYVGHGGMGVVYRAVKSSLNKTVALKLSRTGRLALPSDVRRFRTEAENMAALDHPNIVPVYEVGEHDGRQYFSMKFISGGSLDQRVEEFTSDPRRAARLVLALARAVRYAHQGGILHRDLKPANILLDEDGEPHITDFGLARRLESKASLTASGSVMGTPMYMAPEQARGDKRRLTWAADIFSLGAILYELLTGRPPFRGETLHETLRRVQEVEPEPIRSLNGRVDRDLETITLKCLEKQPESRYESAKALVDDLECWLRRAPIRARPIGRPARTWRWCQRNPGLATLLASASLLLASLIAAAILRTGEVAARQKEVLRGNTFLAKLVADILHNRIEEWSGLVLRTSREPGLVRLLRSCDAAGLQALLERLPEQSAVENWQVFDADGVLLARTPRHAVIGTNFSERDYFRGAMKHAGHVGMDGVHVSKVYRSVADRLYKFDLCATVDAPNGDTLGVVAVAVTTDSNWGLTQLDDRRHVVALIGHGDTHRRADDPGPPLPEQLVLLHAAFDYGVDAVRIETDAIPAELGVRTCPGELGGDASRRGSGSESNYRDPVAGRLGSADYSGRWLAGFAPVGQTGFVVVVQQRYDDVVGLEDSLVGDPGFWAWIVVGFVLLVLAVFGLLGLRRQSRSRHG